MQTTAITSKLYRRIYQDRIMPNYYCNKVKAWILTSKLYLFASTKSEWVFNALSSLLHSLHCFFDDWIEKDTCMSILILIHTQMKHFRWGRRPSSFHIEMWLFVRIRMTSFFLTEDLSSGFHYFYNISLFPTTKIKYSEGNIAFN